MAAFLIFCSTTEVSPDHFEARVLVVPAGEADSALPTRSESRIFEGAELADSECRRMAEAMKQRLQRWGHQVLGIEAPVPAALALNTPAASAGTGSR